MLRTLIAAGTLTVVAGVTTAGSSFNDGDIYMLTSNWPGLVGVVAKIDPVTGLKEVVYDFPGHTFERNISFDPWRDRLIIMPDTPGQKMQFIDADGTVTDLVGPFGGPDVAGWAPAGDGRIYIVTNLGYFGYLNADDENHLLYDTDGTTHLQVPYGNTNGEHLIYDAGTNSLFLVSVADPDPATQGTVLTKLPLSPDGTQLAGPPEVVHYDAFPNEWDEPKGFSAGPNGELFIKIRAQSNDAGLMMFTVHPETLVFTPYAYIQHSMSVWNSAGVYSAVHDQGYAVDAFNGHIRAYSSGAGIQEGVIVASGVSRGGGTDLVGMVCIGTSINGSPQPPPCADADGSGSVDVNDLLAVIAAWGVCGGCPEDFTGDGIVDVADLLFVLTTWGPC